MIIIYFDQRISVFYSRSISVPPVILEKVEGERPTSPTLTEAQQFVKADIESSFKSFFKVSCV